jgi:tRNA U34 5-methylaminomethyl-2-thiouridine-forming methyltransferase MnmC
VTAAFKLVKLPNNGRAVHSLAYGETMHPGLGPAAEADTVHVQQLKLRERLRRCSGEFVVWDVGLGAAANALGVLRATRDCPGPLRVVSFDNTLEPLAFALEHSEALGYFAGHAKAVREILEHSKADFRDGERKVKWELHVADFPSLLAGPGAHKLSQPDAILFDAFSPAKNPAMWTLPLFTNLFRLLNPLRPCALTTYSRSTMFRVTLLLAGFFVGRGQPTGLKEETTVAANTLDLLDEPLDRHWLTRAQGSGSAEPLHEPVYRQAPLSPRTWEKLRRHPQFR